MKNGLLFTAILGLAVVAAQPGPLPAQTPTAPATSTDYSKPGSGGTALPAVQNVVNRELPNWLQINGSIRGRWEEGVVNMKGNVTDGYYLNRIRLDLALVPTSWFSVFAELEDTRIWGYDHGVPTGSQQDPFALRQGYVQLGGGETRGQWIRAGRQEVMLGAGRIFTALEFTNTGRSFDVIRSAYYRPGVRLEVLAGSVVTTAPHGFDWHKPGEHFYGTYNTLDKLIPGASLEPYFFVKTKLDVVSELGGPMADATLFIPGVRFAGKAHRIDYSLELLHESGNYSSDRVSALGGTYTVGWTLSTTGWRPRISGDFSHASGDNNPKDGVRRTFDQLYGGNWPFSSLTGMFGWQNVHNLRSGVDFTPLRRFKVMVDFRDIYLATTQDGLYNTTGTSVILDRAATSTHVGEGVEVQLAYGWPHGFTTSTGVGTLTCGEFLKQAGQRGTYTYPFFMWGKKF